MAIVINEFEVVPQTQSPAQPAENQQQGTAPTAAGSTERELLQRIERLQERLNRVWAH